MLNKAVGGISLVVLLAGCGGHSSGLAQGAAPSTASATPTSTRRAGPGPLPKATPTAALGGGRALSTPTDTDFPSGLPSALPNALGSLGGDLAACSKISVIYAKGGTFINMTPQDDRQEYKVRVYDYADMLTKAAVGGSARLQGTVAEYAKQMRGLADAVASGGEPDEAALLPAAEAFTLACVPGAPTAFPTDLSN